METNSRNENPKNHLEDLIFHEVLPKLPAKSLLRFKTVARHGNAFITSVEFLKTHVRYLPSLNSSSRSVLILDARFFQYFDYGEASIPIAPKKEQSSNERGGCFDFLLSSCKCLSFLVSPCCFKTEGEDENDDDGDGIARKRFGRRWIGYYDILLSSCNGIAFLASPSDVDFRCRNVIEIWMWKNLERSSLFRVQADHHHACDFFRISKTDHLLIYSCCAYYSSSNQTGIEYELYLSDLNGNKHRLIVLSPPWNVVNYVLSLESVLAMNSE